MTDEELKAIEERWEKANEVLNGVGVYNNNWTKSHKGMLYLAVQDIPVLVAAIKSLTIKAGYLGILPEDSYAAHSCAISRFDALVRAYKKNCLPCSSCKMDSAGDCTRRCDDNFSGWQFDEERIGKDGDGA